MATCLQGPLPRLLSHLRLVEAKPSRSKAKDKPGQAKHKRSQVEPSHAKQKQNQGQGKARKGKTCPSRSKLQEETLTCLKGWGYLVGPSASDACTSKLELKGWGYLVGPPCEQRLNIETIALEGKVFSQPPMQATSAPLNYRPGGGGI